MLAGCPDPRPAIGPRCESRSPIAVRSTRAVDPEDQAMRRVLAGASHHRLDPFPRVRAAQNGEGYRTAGCSSVACASSRRSAVPRRSGSR
jgi:hypothetical protein